MDSHNGLVTSLDIPGITRDIARASELLRAPFAARDMRTVSVHNRWEPHLVAGLAPGLPPQ